MPFLASMPPVQISHTDLAAWGQVWLQTDPTNPKSEPNSFAKKEGMDFGKIVDTAVGDSVAAMLGGVNIIVPGQNEIMPKKPDVVEVGPVRVIGGIRPQNYDVGYRPDGVRFLCDSKTLNDTKSVGKNFQNMVNDLGTEATTAHMRFPYAVVTFIVVIPTPCFPDQVKTRYTPMLDRLVGRESPTDAVHMAEAVSLVLWDPATGTIDPDWPEPGSDLRIERFHELVEEQYHSRYAGMPPHHKA